MASNYFHRNCNKTSRRFFEDFDLLPYEVKMLLCHQDRMPTFEDLRAAWDLAGETFSVEDLIQSLNVYEEDRKAERARRRAEELELERRAKMEKRRNRLNERLRGPAIYRQVLLKDKDAKHARLVQRVNDEEAVRLLATRKENADVRPAGPRIVNRFLGYAKDLGVKEEEVVYFEQKASNHICKQMHNA